jgi:hypothetical protein
VIGGPLSSKSWVDLRYLDDLDEFEFQRRLKSGRIVPITSLIKEVLPNLLDNPLRRTIAARPKFPS